jgi:serine/threonine protein kinase/ABC-type glycerol-3-phosphate transport system substrate-binding protein
MVRLVMVIALMIIGTTSCAKLLIPNMPQFARLSEHRDNFVKTYGQQVEIIKSASLNTMAEEVRVDIGASSDPLNVYDAYCLKTTWVPELADSGLLENLIGYIRENPQMRWSDILPFAREYLSSYGRSVFVVPNDADFFFMAYRKDIFAKFNVQSPETWEDFLEIAHRLNGTDMNNDGEGDFGTCLITAQDAIFFPYWMAIASSVFQYDGTMQGVLIDPDSNELLVSNEGFEYAANLHRNISRYARSQTTWADQHQDFLAGRCAMTINLPGGIKPISLGKLAVNSTFNSDPIITLRSPGSSVIWDRQRSRLAPCTDQICKYAQFGRGGSRLINRAPFYGTGGWAFAIRKSADDEAKKTAFNFIAYVNEPERSIRDVAGGTLFDTFRSSHLATDDVFLNSGWSVSRLQELRAITKDALDNPNAALDFSFPGQSDLNSAFSTSLHSFMLGQLPLDKVRDHVLVAWNKLQIKYGNEKLRNFVRQSIGLSAIEIKAGGTDFTIPVIITCGVVFSVLIGTCGLVRYHQTKLDSISIINVKDITYDDPPFCLGTGSAWTVFRAYYRGTTVAIKQSSESCFGGGSVAFDMGEKDRGIIVHELGMLSSEVVQPIELRSSGRQLKDNWLVAQQADGGLPRKSFRSMSMLSLGGSASLLGKNKGEFLTKIRPVSQLRHPCITTVMGVIVKSGYESAQCMPITGQPALVVEYMSNGSLRDLLHNQCVPLDTDMALPMIRDIVQGMRFLHAGRRPVVHGDLKSSNVLVDSNFRAKVADFGISLRAGAAGSPYWMAPELLRGESSTKMSDVYAFGITLWEVLTRKEPYADLQALYTKASVLAMVQDRTLRPDIQGIQRKDLLLLMQECWAEDPAARPTFEAIEALLVPLISQDVYSTVHMALVGRSMNVLRDVFPPHVAEALIAGRKVEPEHHDSVTVYFSDIIGFTNISSELAPIEVSEMLHSLYTRLDALADQHGVFKVETIGDAWMGVTNLVQTQPDHAARIARFALDAVGAARATPIRANDPTSGTVRIRVGFHSGPVVANVVGSRNPRFCLFGDTGPLVWRYSSV